MRRTSMLLMLTGLALGCSHTRSVSHQAAEPSPSQGQKQEDKAKRDRSGERKHRTTTGETAEPVPLTPSPAGQLRPGAIGGLQDKLIERGYLDRDARSQELDGKTEQALRRFQRDQGLPATGIPDDLTVQKLGLSPGEVFRSGPK